MGDRLNFEAIIARTTKSHAYCTDVVLVRLKDTHCRELSVHIHPALFHNRDCEPRYLIGIAENEERERDALGIAVDTTQSDGPAPVMIGNSVSCSSSETPTEADGADVLEEARFPEMDPREGFSTLPWVASESLGQLPEPLLWPALRQPCSQNSQSPMRELYLQVAHEHNRCNFL